MSFQLRFLMVIIYFSLLTACSGGGRDAVTAPGPTTVTAPIGPIGGTVVSGDGLLMLEIPAGALSSMEVIQVTRLSMAETDPMLAALDPDLVYRLEPDGLQFQMPITVTLSMGAPLENLPGQVSTTAMFPLIASNGSLETVEELTIEVDVQADTVKVCGGLSHFSEIAGYSRRTFANTVFSVTYPTELMGNQSGTLTGRVDQNASAIQDSGPILWGTLDSPDIDSTIEAGEEFNATGLLITTEQHLNKTASFSCLNSGLNSFSTIFELTFHEILSFSTDKSQIVLRNLIVNCVPATGGMNPLPYTTPQLFNFPQLSSIEAIRPVPPLFPNEEEFQLALASQDGAALVRLTDGSTSTFFNSSPGESFFDVMLFPPQNPGEDAGLVLSGTDLVVERVDSNGNLGVFAQVNGAQHLDSNYNGNDPANGGHVAGPGVITKIVYQPLSQGYEFQDTGIPVSQIPTGLQSVQANAAGDKFLAVGAFELFYIVGSGPSAVGSSVASLGSNPRRIRWDPTTGLGGISDFIDDTVTLFLWDGQSPPTITQTVTVGDGPVGIDVSGYRVTSAGFNDNSYTIIEVDANGMATATSTNPSPFGPGGLNPGHIIFLNDPYNSVVLSFNGDSTVGVIPFAY